MQSSMTPQQNSEFDPLTYQFELDAIQFDRIDPLTSGLSRGIMDFMLQNTSHAQWIHKLRQERLVNKPFSPGHATRLNRYLVQNVLLQNNNYDKLEEFPNRDEVRTLLETIFYDEDKRMDYELDHSYFDPITSKPSRYYGVLLAQTILLNLDESFTHIDFGCGNNTGITLEHIVSNNTYRPLRGVLPPPPKLAAASPHEKELFQSTITTAQKSTLEKGWGIDILHPWEPFVNQFGIACNPAKLLMSESYFDMRRTLIAHRETNPSIHFARYDITEKQFYTKPSTANGKYRVSLNNRLETYKVDQLPKQADIASAFYVMYMHSAENRKTIYDNMSNLGRLILIYDAIERIDRNKHLHPIEQIQFADYWRPYSSALVAYDQYNPHKGWQLITRSRDGDFSELRPGNVLKQRLLKAA